MRIKLTAIAVILAAVMSPPQTVLAQLQPHEIVILAVSGSVESNALAEYYAQQRGIPAEQICRIEVVPQKTLDREDWESRVRPFIRNWLITHRLETRVRCLVTTFDIPLKIGRLPPAVHAGRLVYLSAERSECVKRIEQVLVMVAGLAGGEELPANRALAANTELKLISRKMSDVFREARVRISKIKGEPDSQRSMELFVEAISKSGGLRDAIRFWSAEKTDDPVKELEVANKVEQAKGRHHGLLEGRQVLSTMPESVERDEQMLSLVELTDGLLGTIVWIDRQIKNLRKNESNSAFDSELSLIFWPQYPLVQWVPNLLHYRNLNHRAARTRITLMVSRLEAPTLKRCKQLIDESIAAEKNGLKGKVYIDARGLRSQPNAPRGSYTDYDNSLRRFASIWPEYTDQEVTLNNEPKVFPVGTCPETALYSGWYSLANYVDAFTFVPGAVGYHIASSEATTLRDPTSKVWCKRMIEDGIAATLGPAFEPYLMAFPRPDEFFVVLGAGRMTLAECYYRTKPFNSWAMILVGDPLYRPFAKNPPIDFERLPDDWKKIVTPLP